MHWINCNVCLTNSSNVREMYCTSCCHIFCEKCVVKCQPFCIICNTQCKILKLGPEIPSSVKSYFEHPKDLMSKVEKTIKFQLEQMFGFANGTLNRTKEYNELKNQFIQFKSQYEAIKEGIQQETTLINRLKEKDLTPRTRHALINGSTNYSAFKTPDRIGLETNLRKMHTSSPLYASQSQFSRIRHPESPNYILHKTPDSMDLPLSIRKMQIQKPTICGSQSQFPHSSYPSSQFRSSQNYNQNKPTTDIFGSHFMK